MKKQYNAPELTVVPLQGTSIVAASAQITGDTTPSGENLGNIGGGGSAWDDAAVKQGNIWDDEW